MLASGLNISPWGSLLGLGLNISPWGSLLGLGLNYSLGAISRPDLLIRHENPADEIGQQTATSEEHEKQPNDADKSRVNSEIFSHATANASDLFVF